MTTLPPAATRPVTWLSVLEEALPVYDMVLTEHRVVQAEVDTLFATARNFDFMTVRSPLVTAMMTARALPSRLRGKALDAPTRLCLASDPGALPGWLILGQVPGRELAFGAIGRFWTADIEWHLVAPDDFAAFDEPGWGKIACHLLVRSDGPGRSVLTYECRTATTDLASRHSMGRYWWAIRPFVGYVLRASLRTIARDAERCP
jgi:hypothetical protein